MNYELKTLFVALCCWLCMSAPDAQAADSRPQLIPQPQTVSYASGTLTLGKHCTVSYAAASLQPVAQYLQQRLASLADIDVGVSAGRKGLITLALSGRRLPAGAYTLSISPQGISITGRDYEGVANGIATLSQLLLQQGTQLPAMTVTDAPQYAWRGFHLDSSRHFWTPAEVKQVIDMMALYKLNRFHWHLTDDQGWRIEIKKYPLLTERGAWRIRNNQDSACVRLARQNDTPDMLLPPERLRVVEGDTLYGGYYSQQDIRDIVAYARQRGIEIMPEIDMPGHFLSAIDYYDGLACFPQVGWGEWFTTPLCPGKDRVLEFCKDIWREVIDLFPFEYVHVGGDEVRKDTWQRCPDCQQRIAKQGLKDEEQLQSWFIHQMEAYINRQGRKMMGWDEILEGGLSPTATVTWWRTWVPDAPQRIVDQGNDVILCPGSPMYFSQGEENNSTRDVYNYSPPSSILPPPSSILPSPSRKARRGRVLGVQGNLWTEYVPTIDRAFYQYFPRVMALSELAWCDPAKRDYADFTARLPQHFRMLQKLGIPYRTPAPEGFYRMNAFTTEGCLTVTCADPSAHVRFTTDGSIPTADAQLYTGPVTVSETTQFALRTFRPDGRAGETVYTDFVKQGYLEPVIPPSSFLPNPGLTAYWHDFREYKCDKMHLTPIRQTFSVDDVCIPEGVSGHIGLIIRGYLNIPADGIYTFALKSDDGSLLKIDGNMVVDNDRPQSPHEEIGQQALRAGLHTLELRYYDHNGGMLRLHVLDPNGRLMSPADIYRRLR